MGRIEAARGGVFGFGLGGFGLGVLLVFVCFFCWLVGLVVFFWLFLVLGSGLGWVWFVCLGMVWVCSVLGSLPRKLGLALGRVFCWFSFFFAAWFDGVGSGLVWFCLFSFLVGLACSVAVGLVVREICLGWCGCGVWC